MAVTTTGSGTSAGDRTLRTSLASLFPIRPVILPWIVARLITVPVLVFTTPGRGFYAGSLLSMDGRWFRMIALDWYDRPYVAGAWSEYPFFPLFPAAGGALMKGGMPSTVALAGLSWLASLLAFAAIHRLAVVHGGPAVARWGVWFVALSPGALSLVLGYSDAFYLAALAWALVFAGNGRWAAAGAAAAVATASRPNGWIAAVAVIVVVIARADRSWRAVVLVTAPSAMFLLGWFWYLDHATGDPFVFWSAKSAWEETSIVEWAGRPLTDHLEVFHVAWFAVALVFYLRRVTHQPPEWLAVTVLTVVPALLFGVVGLARYAVLAFPMQLAVADSLSRRPTWVTWAALACSAIGLGYFAHAVVADSWLP